MHLTHSTNVLIHRKPYKYNSEYLLDLCQDSGRNVLIGRHEFQWDVIRSSLCGCRNTAPSDGSSFNRLRCVIKLG